MPPFTAIKLDPDHPEREVDLIVHDDNITDWNLSKRKEGLERLSTPIHEGLRFNQTPRPLTYSKHPFAKAISLKPPRASEITSDSGTSVGATIGLNTTAISGNRASAQRVHDGETDIMSGRIVTSAGITKTYDGLKSGAHNGNLVIT